MIAFLSGIPVLTGDRWVVVDVHGVGYQVQITQPASRQLEGRHGKVTLYTHLALREDAVTLYGFLDQSEADMFRILIGVTGIGPQTAMNLLSQIGIGEFAIAILDEDEKTLTRISGIGTKSAKRLILELRDKMKKISETLPRNETGSASIVIHDSISALVSLGFAENKSRDAVRAAAQASGNSTAQELIKTALVLLKEQ